MNYQVRYSTFSITNFIKTSLFFADTIQSTRDQLSKYLPLRFLICMISAISNPFLYSYFNETFKDGLKRIFSLCYPPLKQSLIRKSIDQTDYSRTRETFNNSMKSSSILNHANTYPLSLKSTSFGTPLCSLSESANL